MKKFLFSFLLLTIALNAFSQGQYMSDVKLRYDDNFRPYVEAIISNYSGYKAITSIEFTMCHSANWSHYETIPIKIYIPAGSSKKIGFYFDGIRGSNASRVCIWRVRYEDGSIYVFPFDQRVNHKLDY